MVIKMHFGPQGFSFIELLVGITLSAILGAFAYKVFTSTLSVQVSQKDLSTYQGTAAEALEGIRRDIKFADISLIKSGFPSISVLNYSTSPNIPYTPNQRLSVWFPERTKKLFTLTQPYDWAAGLNPLSPTPPFLGGVGWCVPISPLVDATDLFSYVPGTTYPNWTILWAPGLSLNYYSNLTSCHTDSVTGKTDGGNIVSLPAQSPNDGRTRYIPANALIGRQLTSRAVGLVFPLSGIGGLAPVASDIGSIYTYVSSSATLGVDTSSSLPARTLSFTFDVAGTEKASLTTDKDKRDVTAININVGGAVETRTTDGKRKVVDVPFKFKVKFDSRSNTDAFPTDTNLLTPNLATISGRGVGQLAVDDKGGNVYLYVPTVEWSALANPIESSIGHITVIDSTDGSVKKDWILKWNSVSNPGNPLNFIPMKATVASSGIVIGGYARDMDAGRTRRAILFHIPREGFDPNNKINWSATPTYQVLGDENATQPPAVNAPARSGQHLYYMADTSNVAVTGNTIYFGSYTRTAAILLDDFFNRSQVYQTTVVNPTSAPTVSATYSIIDEFPDMWPLANLNYLSGKLLSAMAINASGDHLYKCYDWDYPTWANSWTDLKGALYSGNPLTSTFQDDKGSPPEYAKLGSYAEFYAQDGTCTGMDVDSTNRLIFTSKFNFYVFSQSHIDAIVTAVANGTTVITRLLSMNPGAGGGWATEYNVGADNLSEESGLTSYVLRGVQGLGIRKPTPVGQAYAELYYSEVSSPDPAATSKIGKFTHEPMGSVPRFVMALAPVKTASLMNQAALTTMSRQPDDLGIYGMLMPPSGVSSTNALSHEPFNCAPHDPYPPYTVATDPWDDCIRKKLGGQSL
ncbi:MAG TPA: type II secretion system protein [Bdellovibrionota bacterium]|nr:type II secretion system protein [Bdellovibrionota bacterium]